MRLRRVGLVCVAFALACAGSVVSESDAPRMSAAELKGLLGRPDVAVIDVRSGSDWTGSAEKIAGAVREEPGQEASWSGKYGKDKTLVLYCS